MADQAAKAAAQVHRKDRDGLAWLELDAPPLNLLSFALRAALWQAVEGAEADPEVRGLVISAAGRSFPAGADIAELDQPPQAPSLSDLCDRIEACGKPVVVALHGSVLGGGLELALAAHGRVALAKARLGLPEVNLGLLPGAGGTQRLPRLIGAEQALRLMLTGRPVPAAEALALGLLDRVVEGGLAAAAVAEMARLAALPALPRTRDRREGMRDGLVYQRVVAEAQRGLTDHRLPAPLRIVECVEAAQLLPFEAGRAFEAAAFEDLLASPEAMALRHVAGAEQRAARFAETRQSPLPLLPALTRVGVHGAAQADLALPLLQAGLEVVLVDPNRARLVQGLELLAARQEQALAEGRLTPQQRDAEWARLGSALGAAALADCGAVLVAEATLLPEAMEATVPGCLLALIGRGAVEPGARGPDLLGFRPGGGRLVELVVTPATAPGQVLQAQALARKLGLVTLRCAVPGGVVARIMAAGRAAVAHLLMQGEPGAGVAAALVGFGLPQLAPEGAVASGTAGRQVLPRVLSAMANEGARLLGHRMVESPDEIDFAMVAAQAFPRWEGGPMFWADRRGIMILRRDLEQWAEEAPEIWGMAPVLADLAAKGARFSSLG